MISICIPVFNVEGYIERCSRSLFEQTYSDLEYVFVDDYSSDASMDILDSVIAEYPTRKKHVRIIKHKKNMGIAATRNTAINNANGDFLFFVDSDDWIEENAIEILDKKRHENGADIVSGCILEHRTGGICIRTGQYYVNSDRRERMIQVMSGSIGYSICGRLIKRSLFEDYNIHSLDGDNMAEDLRLIILLSYFANDVIMTDDIVYHYDKTNSSSIMHVSNKSKGLQNSCEYFNNVVSLYAFFKDKERDLYEKSICMTAEIWKLARKMSLRCFNRVKFKFLVDWIDSHDDCAIIFNWKKNGLKSIIEHSFVFSTICYQINRANLYFRRCFIPRELS